MSIGSSIKYLIILVLVSVLSCTLQQRSVKDIAQLDYGDSEKETLKKLGPGSPAFYFILNGVNYSYREYITYYHGSYGLLFSKNELFAVIKLPFEAPIKCADLENGASWNKCLTEAVDNMHTHRLMIDTNVLADEVEEEKKTYRKESAGVAAVGIPLMVVAWPLFVGFGAMCAGPEIVAERQAFCNNAREDIFEQISTLYPDGNRISVTEKLNSLYPDLQHAGLSDTSINDRSVVAMKWRCPPSGSYAGDHSTSVNIGFHGDAIKWLSLDKISLGNRSDYVDEYTEEDIERGKKIKGCQGSWEEIKKCMEEKK